MEKRFLCSVVLELDSQPKKVPLKLKLPVRKLNTKQDRSNPKSGRESPRKYTTPSKIAYSARVTPNQSILDIGRDFTQPEDRIESARFSSLPRSSSVQKKPLPRLYTETTQKKPATRLESLKERYGDLYKYMVKAHDFSTEREEPKETMKNNKPVFEGTYSVKYFGVMNSEMGIASQRVPIQSILQEYAVGKSTNNLQSSPLLSREVSLSRNLNRESAANSAAGSTWNLDNYRSTGKEYASQNDIMSLYNEQAGGVQHQGSFSPSLDRKNKRVMVYPLNPFEEEIKYQLVSASQKNPLRSVTDLDDRRAANSDPNSLMERMRRHLTSVNIEKAKGTSTEKSPEIRVITSYSFPKKTDLKKRKQAEKEEGEKIARQDHEREPREIPLLKICNKKMVTEFQAKENKEELGLLEKAKGYESKGSTSSKMDLGRVKLPISLSLRKKPEVLEEFIVENYKKIEEKYTPVRSQSEKKRKAREKNSYSPRNKLGHEHGESKFFGVKGTFQMRNREMTANSLYNAFLKKPENLQKQYNIVLASPYTKITLED